MNKFLVTIILLLNPLHTLAKYCMTKVCQNIFEPAIFLSKYDGIIVQLLEMISKHRFVKVRVSRQQGIFYILVSSK